jgi:hypothetical protein
MNNPLKHFGIRTDNKSKNYSITIPCRHCKKTTDAWEIREDGKILTRCKECLKPFSIREYGGEEQLK